MKGLLADLKHALRLYRRTPASSLIAVLVLAVGMAFVTAFLSLYVDLVLRPHAGIEQSGRIVTLGQNDGTRLTGLPIGLIERAAGEVTSLEAVAGVEATSFALGPDGEMKSVEVVTREFFAGIRPKLLLGRGLEPTDHEQGGEPVAVISEAYWRQALGGSEDALGTMIEIGRPQAFRVVDGRAEPVETERNAVEFRIVGIMSAELAGIMTNEAAAWLSFESIIPLLFGDANIEQMRTSLAMRSLGRLSAGASAAAVIREINARYSESTEEFTLRPGLRLDAIGGVVRNINVHRDARRQLQLFLSGSVLLALVAAANVSLFLLARAPGRRRELGIRMAVGAPLKRLARQLASEAGLLVVVSAALGLLLSMWLSAYLRGLAFLRQAEWSNVTLLDWRVLTLIGAFLLLLAVLVSLAPVLGLKRLGIAASSRQVGARATVGQRIAGTAQIAIAGTLGGAAIAFGWYLGSMVLGHPGYETRNLHMVSLFPVQAQAAVISFQGSMVDSVRRREAIESVPGITGVAFGSPIPGQGGRSTRTIQDPSNPAEQIELRTGSFDGSFVELLGLRLLHGRSPTDDDAGVALVNRTLARRVFGRDDVVGESLPLAGPGGPRTEIVGVLADLSFDHPAADVEPMVFMTGTPNPFQSTAVVESTLPTGELQQRLRDLVESGALEGNVGIVQPLAELRRNQIAPDTARSWLTIGTASLVVLLAAFGFYGTQRYLVTAGRREYAIRASLGAGPKALGRLVFWRGLLLSLPGLAAGALLAFIAVAWLRDDFISREISPAAVTLAVVAGLSLLLLAASLGPARQARRTQPAPLLREE